MPQYAATTKLLDKDLESVSPDTATKNIEMWQESLQQMDSKEAKAIARDLEALKKEMGKKEPSSDKIFELLGKLGEATVAIADQAPEATAEKIRGIGEALTASGEGGSERASRDDGEEEMDGEATEEGESRSRRRAKA
jgi:hypothetical protein